MHHSNTDVTTAFMDPTLPTMANVIAIVDGDTTLSVARRRNLASSVRMFCKALGSEPSKVPANYTYIRERLKRFHHLEAGIKKKRWQTIKSDVNAAMAIAGITKGQTRGLAPPSPDWSALKAHMEQWRYNWAFGRLAGYCSKLAITPKKVTDTVMARYAEAMREETFKTNIDGLMRELCIDWNKLVESAPEFDLQVVTVPSRRNWVTPPWETLPEGFRADTDAFLAAMSSEAELFSETGLIKPLRPGSIASYHYRIRRAHAVLVATGMPQAAITTLDVLIRPENAKRILAHLFERAGKKKGSVVHDIAHVLVLIAGPGGRGTAEVTKQLKRFRKQMALPNTGMRPRPRSALRTFADTANIEKILCLPGRIYDRLRRKAELTIADARLMQVAVALELFLMRPNRRGNMVALRLDENVIRARSGIFIRIPFDEVKNGVELDYKIPRESAELLEFYIKRALPMFGPNPEGWLFPGDKDGQHKSDAQFGRFFTKTIRNQTGLHVYPHLMRHFAALVYLRENPGAYEVVRRVLAHKSLTTTTRSYASFDDDAAVRLYDSLILRIRDSINSEMENDAAK